MWYVVHRINQKARSPRFNEYVRGTGISAKRGQDENMINSAEAKYIPHEGHHTSLNDSTVLREVEDTRKLDIEEP